MSKIKILPEFRAMVWGNQELNSIFNINSKEPIGEIWLLSGHHLYENRLDTGETVNEFGKKIYNGKYKRFPILIKLVSTSKWLSVQVHPDDEFAQKIENEPWGKSEAWYFLTDGEFAICENVDELEKLAKKNELEKLPEILKFAKVKQGTFVNIPAGTVHALGPNSTVIEVQQSSDLTYRIYDWGRPRETHLEKALKVSKNIKVDDIVFENVTNLSSKYFTMEIFETKESFVNSSSSLSLPIIKIPTKIDKNFCASISYEKEFEQGQIYVYNFL